MNDFDWGQYDYTDLTPTKKTKVKEETPSDTGSFDWGQYDSSEYAPEQVEEESFGKKAFRTAAQIPQGIAEFTPPGIAASLFQLLATGESDLSVEDWQRVRKAYEDKGETFDEDAYERGRQEMLGSIPTVSNIARKVEEETGLPLEPKEGYQKWLRLASGAGKGTPKGFGFRGTNTPLPRPVLGAGVATSSQLLQQMGVPEGVADIASFGILKPTTGGSINIGKEKKPSGLTTRQYEKLEKPREVSQSKINQINQKVENEFRQITNKIIEESPIKETHANLANDAKFKSNASESFKEVQSLADTMPQVFETKQIEDSLQKLLDKKMDKGITPSEFDKAKNKFIKQFIDETPEGSFKAGNLVEQYRKNNKQHGEAYEPGKSFAYNRAKRDALGEYNKVIAEMIEKEFPNSEFSNLFKETNKRWADISNAETINKFLDKMFKEGIDFKQARKFFDKEGMTVPFQKALGKEGFAKFETLMNDLVSTEQASKMLKAAKDSGYSDLAKTAAHFIVHPKIGAMKAGWNLIKGGYNTIFEMILDKPQLAITWDKGINAMKAGDYKAAQKEFTLLQKAETAFEHKQRATEQAMAKFNKNKPPRTETIDITHLVEPIKKDFPQKAKDQLQEISKRKNDILQEIMKLPDENSMKYKQNPEVSKLLKETLEKKYNEISLEEMKTLTKLKKQHNID